MKNPFKVGDKIVTKVRGAEVEAVVTSTWADGHAPNVEFGAWSTVATVPTIVSASSAIGSAHN